MEVLTFTGFFPEDGFNFTRQLSKDITSHLLHVLSGSFYKFIVFKIVIYYCRFLKLMTFNILDVWLPYIIFIFLKMSISSH